MSRMRSGMPCASQAMTRSSIQEASAAASSTPQAISQAISRANVVLALIGPKFDVKKLHEPYLGRERSSDQSPTAESASLVNPSVKNAGPRFESLNGDRPALSELPRWETSGRVAEKSCFR